MESLSSDTQHGPEDISQADQVLYVEELGGAGDYWLSITDAARICRVQDVSIRRAITRKVLPVRRMRAGQNKRTRFVRASDLPKAGFPIIDESAAITTEIGKADILSIPRQQQRILQDHQQLLMQLGTMQETLTGHQAQVLADFQRQREQFQSDLHVLQQGQEQQLALTENRFVQAQGNLQQEFTRIEQHLLKDQQAVREDLARVQSDMHEGEERVQGLMHTQEALWKAYKDEILHSLAELSISQQQALRSYQQIVDEMLQQREQTTKERFSAFEQQMIQLNRNLEGHAQKVSEEIMALVAKLSTLQSFTESLSQRVTIQNQDLERLIHQQQTQLDQHARLLPLLPYVQQRLVIEDDVARSLADLEDRLREAQQQEFARYTPLLSLLSAERLEVLARLLQEKSIELASQHDL